MRIVVWIPVGVVACTEGGPVGASGGPMPDFALVDVNPTSARATESVSPRDYLGQVSAWYFGHAN